VTSPVQGPERSHDRVRASAELKVRIGLLPRPPMALKCARPFLSACRWPSVLAISARMSRVLRMYSWSCEFVPEFVSLLLS
jgi:hypothetical protein